MMDLLKAKALIQAIAFASPEPIELGELSSYLGIERNVLEALAQDLDEDMSKPGSGLRLSKAAGGISIVTDPELAEQVSGYLSEMKHTPLTDASMETLAIIAYKQPITKAEIEQIRGVAAESSLITLAQRGLISERGRKSAPGRPILYGTSNDFLIYLGLQDIGQLPGFAAQQGAETGQKLLEIED